MLYICLPVLYYHGNLHVTEEEAYAGGRGFPLSQRSFLFALRKAVQIAMKCGQRHFFDFASNFSKHL